VTGLAASGVVVPPCTAVVGLHYLLGRGVTHTFSTGRLLRVLLPVVGSPLVCAAVKLLLPRDLAASMDVLVT